MPIHIKYTTDYDGAFLTCTGITVGEEVIDKFTEVIESIHFSNLKFLITDRSKCDEYKVSTEHIHTFADITKINFQKNPDLLLVIISSTALEFGMARMYQSMTSSNGFKTYTCHSMEEAKNWIKEEIDYSSFL